MKRYITTIRIIFVLSLLFASLSAWPDSLSTEIRFLIKQKNFIDLVTAANAAQTQRIIKCLENSEDTVEMPYISAIVKNFEPKPLSCKKFIQITIFEKIKPTFERLRLSLALSTPERRLKAYDGTDDLREAHQIKRNIKHPNLSALIGEDLSPAILRPLSDAEVEKARSILSIEINELCETFVRDVASTSISELTKLIPGLRTRFCTNPTGNMPIEIKDPAKRLRFEIFLLAYHRWLDAEIEQLRAKFFRTYLTQLNKFPPILFMKTSTPSNSETLAIYKKVFRLIQQRALKEKKFVLDKNIAERIEKFESDRLQSDNVKNLRSDLLKYLNESVYKKFRKTHHEDYLNDKAAFLRLEEISDEKELKETIVSTAFFLGSLALCSAPIGRIAKLAIPSSLAKSSCLTGVTFGFNIYFLGATNEKYLDAFNAFVTSPDGDALIGSAHNVHENLTSLIVESMLFAGLDFQQAREFTREVRRNFRP